MRDNQTRSAQDRFKLFFDKVNDAVFIYDLEAGGSTTNFIDVNDSACALLGYTREALLNLGPADITAVELADQTGKARKALKRDGSVIYNTVHLTEDGRRIPVEMSSRVFDYKGRKCVISLARDITARRQAEATLNETAESKLKFAAMVSHELRSPMSAITLGLSLILDEPDGMSGEHRELLKVVRDSADRLGRLINDALDFQKMVSGKMVFRMREHDFNDLALSTVMALDLLAKNKGVRVALDIGENLPRAKCDYDKISQVLTNLLTNAIAYTENGEVTVSARHENPVLHVSVRDTGVGIRAEDLPRLFHAFEQLDNGTGRKTGGTGLGLAISKEIILAHNGNIWAESEPGKGSVFHFTLPAGTMESEHGI